MAGRLPGDARAGAGGAQDIAIGGPQAGRGAQGAGQADDSVTDAKIDLQQLRGRPDGQHARRGDAAGNAGPGGGGRGLDGCGALCDGAEQLRKPAPPPRGGLLLHGHGGDAGGVGRRHGRRARERGGDTLAGGGVFVGPGGGEHSGGAGGVQGELAPDELVCAALSQEDGGNRRRRGRVQRAGPAGRAGAKPPGGRGQGDAAGILVPAIRRAGAAVYHQRGVARC